LLTAGLALRALAGAGYRPALLYIDSAKYLDGSVAAAPQGYQALLRVLEPAGGLALVAAVQTRAVGGVDGLLHSPRSPGHTTPVPTGLTRDEFLDRFALAVITQQPLRVAASAARDSVRLFALTRDGDPQVTPIARWQFEDSYPVYPRRYAMPVLTRLAHEHGSSGDLAAVQPLASILRAYQLGGGYTPGPAYAAFLAFGLLGALARRSGLRVACLLVTLSAVVLLAGSDAFEFSWRYQLPAVVLLPLAGMLGVTALVRRRQSRCAAPSG
jgi:hypothetical protein